MKKIILLFPIVILFTCFKAYAQRKPTDVPTIELLIDSHKEQYNRLKERTKNQSTIIAVTELYNKGAEEYKKVHNAIMERMDFFNGILTSVNTGIKIAQKGKDIYRLSTKIIPLLKKVNYDQTTINAIINASKNIYSDSKFILDIIIKSEALYRCTQTTRIKNMEIIDTYISDIHSLMYSLYLHLLGNIEINKKTSDNRSSLQIAQDTGDKFLNNKKYK